MLTFFKYQLQNQDLKPEAQLPMISQKSDGYLCLAHFCICAFFSLLLMTGANQKAIYHIRKFAVQN